MLLKRGETYHVRLWVPADFRDAVGCREVSRSLRTGVSREAERRAATLNARADAFWQLMRVTMQTLTTDQIKGMVKRWLDKELAQYDSVEAAPLWLTTSKNAGELDCLLDELNVMRRRLGAVFRAPAVGYQSPVNGDAIDVDFADTAILHALPLPDVGLDDGDELAACQKVADQLLAEQGVDVDEESRLKLVRSVAAGMRDVIAAQMKTARAAFGLPAQQVQAAPVALLPVPPAKGALLLSQVIDLWLQEAETVRECKAATLMAYRQYKPRILDLLGDRPVEIIKRADVVKAIETLKASGLSKGSVDKFTTGLAMVLKFAEKSDFIGKSPMPPKAVKKPAAGSKKGWVPFLEDELQRFFALPEFRTPAKVIKHPEKFWLPVISVFSGMRLTECAQLDLADLREVDGVLCFDVNEAGDGKSVKNKRSRLVPVHSRLVDLGLLDFADKMRVAGHDRLFPMLEQGSKGSFGEAVGKALNRLVHKATKRPKGDRPVFHSLRKRFASGLMDAGVDKAHIGALLGHDDGRAVTALYTGGYPVATLKDAVERLAVPATDRLKRWKA